MVCLPGLARSAGDFETLATALATDPTTPRRVIALDYRGRGQSDYDRDPANYSFQVELADVLAVLTALDCQPAVFVGTSRGGLLAMLMAAVRPTAIAGVVLNDIGPVIEPKGLMRIKGYVGKLPQPRSYGEAAEILRRLFDAQFPKLTAEDWLASAHRTFKEVDGKLVTNYDPALAKTHGRRRFRKATAAVVAAIRCVKECPGDGDPRRQFRPVVASHRRRDAGAAGYARNPRNTRPGPYPAAGGDGCDRAHRGFRRTLRNGWPAVAKSLFLGPTSRILDKEKGRWRFLAPGLKIHHNFRDEIALSIGRSGRI